MPDMKTFNKADEVQFLTETLNIPPVRAAALVAEGAEAEDLAAQVLLKENQSDPLAAVPVPDPDADREHIEPDVGDLEKPIRADDSAPT